MKALPNVYRPPRHPFVKLFYSILLQDYVYFLPVSCNVRRVDSSKETFIIY